MCRHTCSSGLRSSTDTRRPEPGPSAAQERPGGGGPIGSSREGERPSVLRLPQLGPWGSRAFWPRAWPQRGWEKQASGRPGRNCSSPVMALSPGARQRLRCLESVGPAPHVTGDPLVPRLCGDNINTTGTPAVGPTPPAGRPVQDAARTSASSPAPRPHGVLESRPRAGDSAGGAPGGPW